MRYRGCSLLLLTFGLDVLLTLGVRLLSALVIDVAEHPRSRLMRKVVSEAFKTLLSDYSLHRLALKRIGDIGLVE